MTFSITALSIMGSFATHRINDTRHCDIQHNVSALMLNAVMLSALMLSAVMLSAIMLSAVMLRAVMLSAVILIVIRRVPLA